MTRLHFLTLAIFAWSTVARADTYFDVGNYFGCSETTLICSSSDSYGLDAIVGIDTVYAPDGVTVIETLTDIVWENPLGPIIANDIATDGSTFPVQLENNLAPFTTLTDVQFDEDNQFFTEDPTDCPLQPTEMLTQAGNLITGVPIDYLGGGEASSPNIYSDLTGSVSNATVTSDVNSLYDNDVFSVDPYVTAAPPSPPPTTSTDVCGTILPAGYYVRMVQSVVINASVENITETENSSAPEPSCATLLLSGITLLIVGRRIQTGAVTGISRL